MNKCDYCKIDDCINCDKAMINCCCPEQSQWIKCIDSLPLQEEFVLITDGVRTATAQINQPVQGNAIINTSITSYWLVFGGMAFETTVYKWWKPLGELPND